MEIKPGCHSGGSAGQLCRREQGELGSPCYQAWLGSFHTGSYLLASLRELTDLFFFWCPRGQETFHEPPTPILESKANLGRCVPVPWRGGGAGDGSVPTWSSQKG